MEPLPKAYQHKDIESKWYRHCLEHRAFEVPETSSAPTFAVMMPPPNVTGVLHMGHLLNNTIQDILVRRARQEGKRVLWIPGTDHAGIATQTKVEKVLAKEGLSRQALGREAFIQRVKAWRNSHGDIISQQLQKLGISPAWEHKVHTLDPDYSRTVLHGFVELHKRGYIYRGKRMIHWCPISRTALSDEEVIMKPQSGFLYHVRYAVVETVGAFIEVATTRPETIMGDVAIAVHPDDERHRALIGKHVHSPIFGATILPIIADTAVDPTFGTGALKITPAHDRVDFEIGQRHHLPFIDIFNPDATLNNLAGKDFEGLDRFTAREKVVQFLEQRGALVKKFPHEHHVGFSERAGVPIEPRLSEQWFLRYPQIEKAQKVVQESQIHFRPQRWVKTYAHWLDNIQDWCISRQLWWGHRIPVWYPKGGDRNDLSKIHISIDGPPDPENWEQEEDVLDTWFSSAFWCLGTLGWPDRERFEPYKCFYPTNDLVTGPDIIFFWVARMIIMGLEFLVGEKGDEGSIPFRNVYFTGIIRDAKGRKMSKSLGNSPEPLELIEKYGADGLRLGLLSMAPQGQDVLFDETRIEQGRFFCNKLWNAFRFRQTHSFDPKENRSLETILRRLRPKYMGSAEHFVLSRLLETNRNCEQALADYEFQPALLQWISFFRNDYCDQYLEISKTAHEESHRTTTLAVQDFILRQLLISLHAWAPFITEELWQASGYSPYKTLLMQTHRPTSEELIEQLQSYGIVLSPTSVQEVHSLLQYLNALRALKARCGQASTRNSHVFYRTQEKERANVIEGSLPILLKMAGLKHCQRVEEALELPSETESEVTFFLDIAHPLDAETERHRIRDELSRVEKLIQLNQQKLKNPDFTSRAPAKAIEGARELLAAHLKKQSELKALLQNL
ncbi:MAG: valine--tRNA ligase [Puniceicoccales bacterium]|jgi:valyl-tRNA synthetase|nr:valine--tRNA ligase [Puniceicoccales bacterium]